ncbi:trigger factor [Marinigracilibium pacificum]|uniref:Trigger factor n=1 Tax=Marinigracilibium pacificum TaxID=2729599 RepID=A0A848J4D2_9BACT|nr:trigger factor [Marinigracilibium pacificum]NMM49334.1 trigger factor [Marinigracilibium pacificum]
MDITLNKKSNTEATIKISLNESDYQSQVAEKIKEYSKKANLKGFRPGKVPTGVIKRMYGKSILVEEVNHIVSHKVSDYIKENNIQVLGQPIPNETAINSIDWDTQKDFDFEYEIGYATEFKADVSKRKKLTKYVIKTSKKNIDETIERLQKQLGETIEPETADAGDVFTGKLTAEDGSFEKDLSLTIDKATKKEQKVFIGTKVGDEITFDIRKSFKKDEDLAEAIGQSIDEVKDLNGNFTFKIEKIERKGEAELNQEFFDKVFGKDAVKSEEEFRTKVEETIKENYDRESGYLLDRDIRDKFVELTKIELPEEFLKQWIVQSNDGQVTLEQVEDEFEAYSRDLKWSMIIDQIAEENEIKVENDEIVDEAKKSIAQQFGGMQMNEEMSQMLDQIAQNYLQQNNGQNYMNIYNQVKGQKVLDFIKDKIDITEEKVDVDKFNELAQN